MTMTLQTSSFKSIISTKSDYLGVTASSLCMVHCILTPVLFAVHATSLSCAEISPVWWKTIDYLFLVISFFAIFYTSKKTTSDWVPFALYTSWTALTFFLVNESLHFVNLPHILMYLPAINLVSLHIYNKRFCHCQVDHSCTI